MKYNLLVFLLFSVIGLYSQPLDPGSIGADQTICYNTQPALLTEITAASGGSGVYDYLWQESSDNIIWNDISAAISQNFQPTQLLVTTYFRRKVNDTFTDAFSNAVTITVRDEFDEGTISTDQTICYNTQPAQITGTAASGGGNVITYQWQESIDASTWTNISSATAQNFQPPNLIETTYYRRQANESTCSYSEYSNTVTITVRDEFDEGTISTNQTICYNTQPAQITGTAASGGGNVITYQWQESIDASTWTNISSETSQNFQPPTLNETTYYRRQANEATCSNSEYSNTVTITVRDEFDAGTISSDQTICYNTQPSHLFGTVASGGGGNFSYQWQYSTDNVIWTNADISLPIFQNFQPPILTETTYYRRISTELICTVSDYSNIVTITVRDEFDEGTISADQTICYNTQPAQLMGTAASGGGDVISYQWQQSIDAITWSNISSETAQNLQPTNLLETTLFRRHATESTCNYSDYSNFVTITVRDEFDAGTISSDQTICYNTQPAQLMGTAASGGGNIITYQWQQSIDDIIWTNISSETAQNYQPPILIQTTYFRREATESTCSEVYYSNTVTIIVHDDFDEGTISADETICYNTQPSQLLGTIASGGGDVISYQWQQSFDAIIWDNILTATSQNYQPTNLIETTYFRREAAESTCNYSDYSNIVTINVRDEFDAGTISADETICYHTQPALLLGTAASGGGNIITYQWQQSFDDIIWEDILSETAQDYQPPILTETTYYRREATESTCNIVEYSNTITITVREDFDPGIIYEDQIICYNTLPADITGTAASGGGEIFTYQWQQSIDDIIWNDISGETSQNYQPTTLIETTFFRREATESTCNYSDYSNTVTITVREEFDAGTISADETICYNTQPALLLGTVASGGGDVISYQWQQSIDDIIWEDIITAIDEDFQPPILTETTYFRREATESTCNIVEYSNTVTITVRDEFDAGTLLADQTICYDTQPDQITGTAASGGGNIITYQWQQSIDDIIWEDILSETAQDYQPPILTETTYFRREATESTCNVTDYSNSVTITVREEYDAGTISEDQFICYDTQPALLIGTEATGGGENFTYQWQQSIDDIIWDDITTATSQDYQPVSLTETTYFRRLATDVTCNISDYSNTIIINVYDELESSGISESQIIPYNAIPELLQGDIPTGGSGVYSYLWQQSVDDGFTWTDIDNANDKDYQPDAIIVNTWFRRISISDICEIYSNVVTIIVRDVLLPGIISENQTICFDMLPEKITGTAAEGSFGNYIYQWQQRAIDEDDWDDIEDEVNLDYQPDILKITTFFRRKVTSGIDEAFSNIVTVETLDSLRQPIISYNSFYCRNSEIVLSHHSDVIWYDSDFIEIDRGTELIVTALFPTTYYAVSVNILGCTGEPFEIEINVDYAEAEITADVYDYEAVENATRITFYPIIDSNHDPSLLNFVWDFQHEQKGLYERHYDMEPAQYFHWEGWHNVILNITTPNNCQFTETRENFFYIEPEKPDPDFKDFEFDLDELENFDNIISLFPNPVVTDLKIRVLEDNLTCEIFMLSGQKVFEKTLFKCDNILTLTNLSSGIYLITIRDNKEQILFIDKLIKKQ